ncbi:hypothetical protein NL676_019097 [Syzygium grande]|nr:hypothetical protein NL676_019097 [Syzygium grande]
MMTSALGTSTVVPALHALGDARGWRQALPHTVTAAVHAASLGDKPPIKKLLLTSSLHLRRLGCLLNVSYCIPVTGLLPELQQIPLSNRIGSIQ